MSLREMIERDDIHLTGLSDGIDNVDLTTIPREELEEVLRKLDQEVEILEEAGELRAQWVRFAIKLGRRAIAGLI